MNRDTHDLTPRTDPDATLVTAAAPPIFTEQAVETARPVVPLNNGAANVAAGVSSRVGLRRPSWLFGLIAVSVLAGTVVGGLGLRFYQKRQRGAAAASAQTVTTPTAAPESSPTPSLVVETEAAQTENSVAAPVIIEVVEADDETRATTTTAPPADDSRGEGARSSKSDEKRTAEESAKPDRASRAGQNGDVDHRGARQKNDRGDDDRERGGTERSEQQRPRRTESPSATRAEGERVANNAGGDDAAPGPRRIDRIRDIMSGGGRRRPQQQQQRRAERRREQAPAGTVDRVRGIFEGRPPR